MPPAPAYSAAHRLGIPVVIHEQNARAGMANKLGARWAQFIGTAYDATGSSPQRMAESSVWDCHCDLP